MSDTGEKKQNAEHFEGSPLETTVSGGLDNLIESFVKSGEVTHNPLKDLTREQVIAAAREFAESKGLAEDSEYFVKGALLAHSDDTSFLTEEELQAIEDEVNHKWKQPKTLYYLCVMCAMCAVVQGMDETVVNGAQLYFFDFLHMTEDDLPNAGWIQGLVVGAPYLCCAVIGSALTEPLNNWFGRRGTIFISCLFAAVASIWEGFTYSWVQLFLARLLLGIGIGPKSTTVPVYAAECTPAPIRGALVMMWQMWTAFGIMLGYVVCLIFMPRGGLDPDVSWRIMLGSTLVAPVLVCAQVFFVPESPRWYIKKNRYDKAFESLQKLRNNKVQAARDLFYMSTMISISEEINRGHNAFLDILLVPRNRRALYASQVVMFMQQFCGVNVIAYYSSTIFSEAGFGNLSALLASFGFGLINFLFAIPAVFTIDTFGRRSLALFTLPFLALFLLFTGFSFYIPETNSQARVGCIALGIYLYAAFYSPGMGPVPFTYSAEVFPLHVRDIGMSLATITLWGFNFILSLTWPPLLKKLSAPGAFGYYAGWNIIGFVLVFCLVPETKGKTLEDLDITFNTKTSTFIGYQIKHIPYNIRKHILLRKGLDREDLYNYDV
ncbi:myo-inositol transporter 1 [Trichomonascus vanleenenianus]|uniref:myo-inositol transporter 1 n=1 Tax=Trichomonascus vanleenenianus TaxID=2268995 RepID=UPI003ECB0F39